MLGSEVRKTFGFRREPFVVREADDVYLTRPMRRAAALVQDALDMQGLIAVVGPVGCGKTTLVKWAFSGARQSERYRIASPRTVDREHLTIGHIQESVILDLGHERPAKSRESQARQIQKILETLLEQGIQPVLYVDEAQAINAHTLRCLKRLREHEYLYMPMLAVVLSGQVGGADDLVRKLGGWDLLELSRRLEVVELGGLGRELKAYLEHKLTRVGGKAGLVDAGALRALARNSDLPLHLDQLLTRAFRLAYERSEKRITEDIIGELINLGEPEETPVAEPAAAAGAARHVA